MRSEPLLKMALACAQYLVGALGGGDGSPMCCGQAMAHWLSRRDYHGPNPTFYLTSISRPPCLRRVVASPRNIEAKSTTTSLLLTTPEPERCAAQLSSIDSDLMA